MRKNNTYTGNTLSNIRNLLSTFYQMEESLQYISISNKEFTYAIHDDNFIIAAKCLLKKFN